MPAYDVYNNALSMDFLNNYDVHAQKIGHKANRGVEEVVVVRP